jgi:hypothetical protein
MIASPHMPRSGKMGENSSGHFVRPVPCYLPGMKCSERAAQGKPLGDDCLRVAAPHIVHELRLLHRNWEGRGTHIGWTLWFMTFRSLWEFFFTYERKKGKDDILAVDFLEAGKWRPVAEDLKQGAPAESDQANAVASKLSAHLTYTRIEEVAAGSMPPSEALTAFMLQTARHWVDKLPTARQGWFEGL